MNYSLTATIALMVVLSIVYKGDCHYVVFFSPITRADNDGGAIYAVDTVIHIRDEVVLTFNRAGRNGGAICLDAGASLTLPMFQ